VAKRGLGKGLDVLISSAAAAEGNRLEEIPVKEMTRSIQTFGVVQPVIVRPVGTEYELIAGERRWRASQEAGLEKIPAVIRQSTETDSLEMALIENIHRTDLNGMEQAAAYQQLLEDFAITHEELSKRIGKSRVTITNTLRLLQLPPRIQKEVMDQRISTGHARALLAFQEQPSKQDTICSRIVAEGLSVRQVEEMAAEKDQEAPPEEERRAKTPPPEEALEMFSRLQEVLETRVRGSVGKRKGRLVIEFRNMSDLRRIFEAITLAGGSEDASDGADQD
jgi:ParB family chromosome partitioning protein